MKCIQNLSCLFALSQTALIVRYAYIRSHASPLKPDRKNDYHRKIHIFLERYIDKNMLIKTYRMSSLEKYADFLAYSGSVFSPVLEKNYQVGILAKRNNNIALLVFHAFT